MSDTSSSMRACSNGETVIETQGGLYHLSREEIHELLFFGRQIPLRQQSSIVDGASIIYQTPSGLGIIICTGSGSYHISRKSFVMVASGEIASSPLIAISRG